MKYINSLQIAALCFTALQAQPSLAGEPARLPFHGTIHIAEGGNVIWPTLFAEGGGTGLATHLGHYTMTFNSTVNLTNGQGIGSSQFTAANGDKVFTKVSGQATPTGLPGVLLIIEESTITGGTGRFAGATGSFTITRQTEPALVDGSTISGGVFDGTIILAHRK